MTPGHTPGSMSFLDIRNKALIVGDAFQTRGGTAVSGQMKFWFFLRWQRGVKKYHYKVQRS